MIVFFACFFVSSCCVPNLLFFQCNAIAGVLPVNNFASFFSILWLCLKVLFLAVCPCLVMSKAVYIIFFLFQYFSFCIFNLFITRECVWKALKNWILKGIACYFRFTSFFSLYLVQNSKFYSLFIRDLFFIIRMHLIWSQFFLRCLRCTDLWWLHFVTKENQAGELEIIGGSIHNITLTISSI